MQIITYYNTESIVKNNVDKLMATNLLQTQKSIKTELSSYEDLLYQMYTNDDIVKSVDEINKGVNIEVNRNQLRRIIHGLASVKPYVQSITIITANDSNVFYDKITGSIIKSSWMDSIGISTQQLFAQISATNDTNIFSTQPALLDNYIFHMGHRIIDYTNVDKKNGIIILSIDEKMLNEVCNQNYLPDGKQTNVNFIVDNRGKLISFVDPAKTCETITNVYSLKEQQDKDYQNFVQTTLHTGGYLSVNTLYDSETGWNLVNVSDQSEVISQMSNQLSMIILVLIISVFLLTVIIILISNRTTSSIDKVVKAMKIAEKGELTVRVSNDRKMPKEIIVIANQFNRMIENINDLIQKVKIATEKQKNAEIAALEAQINPHFLYNSLDTINWMAIDREEYEISNTLNSLAHILRYGIDKSNSIVEIKQEIDWLKQYIFLQQTRLKNSFECHIHVDPNIMQYHIHKLLFQPFVENALLHGFQGIERKHILEVTITEKEDCINIKIADNGKGMSEEMIRELYTDSEEDENHIGVRNAIGRLKMYYGDQCRFQVFSKLGEGTAIQIDMPKE